MVARAAAREARHHGVFWHSLHHSLYRRIPSPFLNPPGSRRETHFPRAMASSADDNARAIERIRAAMPRFRPGGAIPG
jgi:hypothetical protein